MSDSTSARRASFDGFDLLRAFELAAELLDRERTRLNALNVFPVPDGDTGTNMCLTLRGAVHAARSLPESDHASAAGVGAALARGALIEARGNSGVILSQVVRGLFRDLQGRATLEAEQLPDAFRTAAELAYKAVTTPVEGTMLTVMRRAAEAAQGADCVAILMAASAEADRTVVETPSMLPILAQAGVVDAGGAGLAVILDGLARAARGEELPPRPDSDHPTPALGAAMGFLDQVDELHGGDAFGYCINFMVFGAGIDVDRATADLVALGSSAVIAGEPTMLKVHIHSEALGKILDCAIRWGELGQIKIDNMNLQTAGLAAERNQASHPAPPVEGIAVIAVAAGRGVSDVFTSLGATRVIPGGQSMNPSVKDILDAVERVAQQTVMVLPNNGNVILAAGKVPGMTAKQVVVVPTRSVQQGLAALASSDPEADVSTRLAQMNEAIARVRSVEVARADRNVTLNGVTIQQGHWIGLLDDQLVAGGYHLPTVIGSVLGMVGNAVDLITVLTGEDAPPLREHDEVLQVVAAVCPSAEVQVVEGGQPHYRYLLALE